MILELNGRTLSGTGKGSVVFLREGQLTKVTIKDNTAKDDTSVNIHVTGGVTLDKCKIVAGGE